MAYYVAALPVGGMLITWLPASALMVSRRRPTGPAESCFLWTGVPARSISYADLIQLDDYFPFRLSRKSAKRKSNYIENNSCNPIRGA